MKHRSNLLTRTLAVTLAVSMLLDVNGVTALAESADALSGADGYAVTEEAPAEGTTEGVDETKTAEAVEPEAPLTAGDGAQDGASLTLGGSRDKALYIYQGKRQLYFQYSGDCIRNCTVDIRTEVGNKENLAAQNYNADYYYIEDIGLELAPGKEYPATITLKDSGEVVFTQDVVLKYALQYNELYQYVAKQTLVPNGTTGLRAVGFYYEFAPDEFEKFYLLDHETQEQKAVSSDISQSGWGGGSCNPGYRRYYLYRANFALYDVPIGDYDIKVVMKSGESYLFEDCVHIVTDTIIEYTSPANSFASSGYDSTGDYCYISVTTQGDALDTEKFWPVLTNEDGSIEYTEIGNCETR